MAGNGLDQFKGKRAETARKIMTAVTESKGLLTLAAKKAGIGYRTLCKYAELCPTIRQAINESRESITDMAEGKLYQAINAGNMTAIIFYLKTKAKDRGYIERSEFTGAGGGPIQVNNRIEVVSEAAKNLTEQIGAGKGTE